MVLETTMLCLDNSEWMRNGDFGLSRLHAQNEAASLISRGRTDSNPENTVGVLSMAGHGVELLVSPTENLTKILGCFSKLHLSGKSDFSSSVQIAQLALKHRKNKNGGQRIIAFVGSPIFESVETLTKVGKQLKKNGVSVDIVSIGEYEENEQKLKDFMEALTGGNDASSSHLVHVPPGMSPTDVVMSSPIMQDSPHLAGFGGGAAGGGGGAGGGSNDFGGIDPSLDPELALALRLSAEESRAQQETSTRSVIDESRGQMSEAVGAFDEEEELMRQALEMSLREFGGSSSNDIESSSAPPPVETTATAMDESNDADEGDIDEEEALRQALELSMAEEVGNQPQSTANNANVPAFGVGASNDIGGVTDPEFLRLLLGSVDADINDPLIQDALAQLSGASANQTEQRKEPPKKRKSDEKENDNNGNPPSG